MRSFTFKWCNFISHNWTRFLSFCDFKFYNFLFPYTAIALEANENRILIDFVNQVPTLTFPSHSSSCDYCNCKLKGSLCQGQLHSETHLSRYKWAQTQSQNDTVNVHTHEEQETPCHSWIGKNTFSLNFVALRFVPFCFWNSKNECHLLFCERWNFRSFRRRFVYRNEIILWFSFQENIIQTLASF